MKEREVLLYLLRGLLEPPRSRRRRQKEHAWRRNRSLRRGAAIKNVLALRARVLPDDTTDATLRPKQEENQKTRPGSLLPGSKVTQPRSPS